MTSGFDKEQEQVKGAYIGLIVGIILGILLQRPGGLLDQTPNCPSEDSCVVDYHDGQWWIIQDQEFELTPP